MSATIEWRALEPSSLYILLFAFHGLCHLSWLFPLIPLSRFLISPLSFSQEPSGVLSESPSPAWDERCIPYATATTTTTKPTLLLPDTETFVYPDLCLAVIAQNDGQSKAHHILGVKNKLKCAHPCIILCKASTFLVNVCSNNKPRKVLLSQQILSPRAEKAKII